MSKKQDILDASLRLFTENGVRATSTKSIALEANTSEALIFRHFGSKDKLLDEILKKGYQEAVRSVVGYLNVKDPLEYIQNFIKVPSVLVDSNPDFWQMQYKIIALNPLAQKHHQNFMHPCYNRLANSFKELGYDSSELEAELLLIFIDGIWKDFSSRVISLEEKLKITKIAQAKYLKNPQAN